jgi:protein-S-isoprenylcysteine O-methyltransferase Ste14
MSETGERISPWWYRRRGSVIGVIYGLGFLLGYFSLQGPQPQPAAVVWGPAFGGNGVALLAWAGVALVLVAWLLRASGTAYLRREVVFSADALQDRLVVAGPFRYVRNPLYLGNIFLALGVGLYAPPLGFAIIVAGNVAIVAFLAREEARQLALRYGATFEVYRRSVPAFVPRLTPATVPGSSSATPSLRSACLGETGVMLTAVALVPIALFGSAGIVAFWILAAVALLSAYVLNGWLHARKVDIAPRT